LKEKKMMKHLNSILLITILLLFASCGAEKNTSSTAVIKGNYFPSGTKIYLNKVYAGSINTVDSADLSKGEGFSFEVNSPDYALFRLENAELYPLIVVAKNGDIIQVEQTNDPAWPYIVKGNDDCMMVADYLEKLKRDEYKVDSLSQIFHNSQSHPDFLAIRDQLNQEFIKIHEDHKEWAINFVSMHPSSFASLIMINSFFREFLLFDQKKDFRFYELVANATMERMPENKYAQDLNDHVKKIKRTNKKDAEAEIRLSASRLVPDFEMPDMNGNLIGPSAFKGKNLLLYFWSASNARSRQVNPMIKEVYDMYKGSGLEILCFSFDRSVETVQAAIDLDQLPGVHIVDTEGPGSPVQTLFNLKMQLPQYYLIDTQGRIYTHHTDFSTLGKRVYDLFAAPPEY